MTISGFGARSAPGPALFRRYGCGFAFLADEDHQDFGRNVALIEELVLVVQSLDVRLAGFVSMRLSAVLLQLHLALEDIHVGRYRMLVQRRAAARLDVPMTEMISGLSVFG